MDGETLELFTKLSDSIVKDDWKKALNSLFITLRKTFVFDNLAIYLVEKAGAMPEAVYARAAGRGRSKEAEASWGRKLRTRLLQQIRSSWLHPPIRLPLTGLPGHTCLVYPSNLPAGSGAIVFVRFGGPEYTRRTNAVGCPGGCADMPYF